MQTDKIIRLAREQGVIRAADLASIGASRTLLPYLEQKGVLRRVARGAYMLVDHVPERPGFVDIAAAVPHCVIFLLSALQYHEITIQMPNATWLAVERSSRKPVAKGFQLQVVQLSGNMFSAGIEEYEGDGVIIRVYSPAKTVVDCFRFRNRTGLDVAREALRDTLDQRRASRDEIWHFAKICRMASIMRPYLEMV